MYNPYLGKLDYADPLYEILFSNACPDVKTPLFHVNRMSSRRVYKYTEEKSRVAIIGKFFEINDRRHDRVARIKGEFDNLEKVRGYGFDTFPNYVVRPISRDEKIGLALIEEFVHGRDLDYYFKKAIYERDCEGLKDRLSRLALFLYTLHAKTGNGDTVNLDFVSAYFQKIVNKLHRHIIISDSDRVECLKLMDRWLNRTLIQNAKNVIVHGDATPTNFIFTSDGGVVAIDLERVKSCDMVFDVSMVCGELKHAFLWRLGDASGSEPFIRYFLKKYTANFSNCRKAFRKITLRNPFYMALTELRIARNSYLDRNYRMRLAHEAMECLRYGLRMA